MRKVLDRSERGELWMEIMANLTIYHVQGPNGFHLATTKPAEARREWTKLNQAPGVPEKMGA